MNMVDFEMASKFARITEMVDDNGIVYIAPCFHMCGKVVHTRWWAMHFGFQHTDRLNYWKLAPITHHELDNLPDRFFDPADEPHLFGLSPDSIST